MKRPELLILFILLSLSASAQTDTVGVEPSAGYIVEDDFSPAQAADAVAPVVPDYRENRMLFGIGGGNFLDTYISPFEYKGLTYGFFYRMGRATHWGHRRWQFVIQTCTNFSYAHSPTKDGKELYLQSNLGMGLTYNWRPLPHLRLQAGGLVEGCAGVTYNTRGSNNPAQGRVALDIAATGSVEYNFMLFRREMKVRAQLDLPLMGAMFSPHFGQSYYELFSLGHYDKNIRFINPFNAPSARLLCTLDFPIRYATLSLGYHADIRQASVNGLKSHAWTNMFVLGFVRHSKKVRHELRRLE